MIQASFKCLAPVLGSFLLFGLGWAASTPITVTITQRTPIETLSTNGDISGVSNATIGSHYIFVSVQGSQIVLQDAQGTHYLIAQTSTDYVVPQAPSSSPADDTTNAVSSTAPKKSKKPRKSALVSTTDTPAVSTASDAISIPSGSPGTVSGQLTEQQTNAVVLIKGDTGEGTGFLVKTPDGPAVVTNLHVISANPHLQISITTGAQIKILSLKGAADRDLAMIAIQDDHYSYLDLATDIQNTVQTGDEVITPGNSEGGEVVLNTKGKIVGIGPQRIEFSNPIYHGNSGGPVFHTSTGKVVAVVTQAMKVNTSNALDKASFENNASAITSSMRYFGFRLDTVPKWEPYDWNRFLNETTFLKEFHQQTRCLDSFLNGAQYEKAHLTTGSDEGPPDSKFYLRDEKLCAAFDNFHRVPANASVSDRLDAVRELVMDLEGIADSDMASIQDMNNFYTFEQAQAKQEAAYRKAMKTEIETVENRIGDLGH